MPDEKFSIRAGESSLLEVFSNVTLCNLGLLVKEEWCYLTVFEVLTSCELFLLLIELVTIKCLEEAEMRD